MIIAQFSNFVHNCGIHYGHAVRQEAKSARN